MANEKLLDWISRKALIPEYDRVHIGEPGKARKLMEDAPTVDAVEVVHGRWMVSRDSDISKDVWCTACGEGFYIRKKVGAVLIDKMPYCPNCGAKMDGERKDNERKAD